MCSKVNELSDKADAVAQLPSVAVRGPVRDRVARPTSDLDAVPARESASRQCHGLQDILVAEQQYCIKCILVYCLF